jgi:hypothetical protein
MKKITYAILTMAVSSLFLASCSSSNESIVPTAAVVTKDAKTLALINNLTGNWNTDLVKDNGVLIYNKANSRTSVVDYSKFQLELLDNANFKMTDKDNNIIEGLWYVTKDSKLYLDYLKRDFSVPALPSLCEHSCAGVVTVTISFDIKEATAKDKISIENNNVEYQMKHDN